MNSRLPNQPMAQRNALEDATQRSRNQIGAPSFAQLCGGPRPMGSKPAAASPKPTPSRRLVQSAISSRHARISTYCREKVVFFLRDWLPLAFAVWVLGGVLPTDAAGSDVSQAFDTANKLYEQGKFAEAAAAYERLLQGGPSSPALFFNWGNAQFKAGQTGRAIAAYRQAADVLPRDPDLRTNLKFAREQVAGPTLRPRWWERALGTLSLNEWSRLSAAAFWLWLGLLALRQARPALRRALRGWTLAAALVALLLGALLAYNLRVRLAEQTAIVVARDVPVRNGPFEESPTAFTVQDGAEMRVLDRKNDWLQVTTGARRIGWVARQHVLVTPGR